MPVVDQSRLRRGDWIVVRDHHGRAIPAVVRRAGRRVWWNASYWGLYYLPAPSGRTLRNRINIDWAPLGTPYADALLAEAALTR